MDHIQTRTNIQDLVYAHAHDFVSVHMWKPVWCHSHWVFISRINRRRLTCGSFQLTHMSREDHAVQLFTLAIKVAANFFCQICPSEV